MKAIKKYWIFWVVFLIACLLCAGCNKSPTKKEYPVDINDDGTITV